MFKSGIVEGESCEVDSSQTVKGCENWSSQTLYTFGPCNMCFNFNGNFQIYAKSRQNNMHI